MLRRQIALWSGGWDVTLWEPIFAGARDMATNTEWKMRRADGRKRAEILAKQPPRPCEARPPPTVMSPHWPEWETKVKPPYTTRWAKRLEKLAEADPVFWERVKENDDPSRYLHWIDFLTTLVSSDVIDRFVVNHAHSNANHKLVRYLSRFSQEVSNLFARNYRIYLAMQKDPQFMMSLLHYLKRLAPKVPLESFVLKFPFIFFHKLDIVFFKLGHWWYDTFHPEYRERDVFEESELHEVYALGKYMFEVEKLSKNLRDFDDDLCKFEDAVLVIAESIPEWREFCTRVNVGNKTPSTFYSKPEIFAKLITHFEIVPGRIGRLRENYGWEDFWGIPNCFEMILDRPDNEFDEFVEYYERFQAVMDAIYAHKSVRKRFVKLNMSVLFDAWVEERDKGTSVEAFHSRLFEHVFGNLEAVIENLKSGEKLDGLGDEDDVKESVG